MRSVLRNFVESPSNRCAGIWSVPFSGALAYLSAMANRSAHRRDSWPLSERPGFLLRRLHQIHVALFAGNCARFDVTPVQYSLMSALALRVAADQTTLANDVALDRTTVTGALKRLQKRRLIKRVASRSDRRAQECRLTPAGTRILAAMERPARQAHHDTIAALTAKEQAKFIALMVRLLDAHAAADGGAAR
jgi:DNA-binding MarR family transcriptional regulator